MRLRTLVAALLTSVALLTAAAPASAGGWWNSIDLGKRHVTVGDTLRTSTEVMFPSMELARQARSKRYFAYLVQGINQQLLDDAMSQAQPKRWWAQPATAVRAGTVRWGVRDANLSEVVVKLTIPDVPPGRYALMLCNAGCRKPLADVIPTEGIRVYARGARAMARTAQAALDAKQFQFNGEMRDQSLASEIDELRSSVLVAREDARLAADYAARSEQTVGRLTSQVEQLSALVPVSPWPARAGWIVAGVIALLWLGTAVQRRRREELPPAPEVVVDEEWEYAGRR